MTAEQLQALLDYINARIDERIEEAFGRDSAHEYLRANDLKKVMCEEFQVRLF